MQVFKKKLSIFGLFVLFMSPMSMIPQVGIVGGAGAVLELDEGLYGTNTRFFYGPNEQICFGPEISFFPYQEVNDAYKISILDLNFNAHYIFELNDKLGIYPLTGINYTVEKEQLIAQNDETKKEDEFGLNYGFGAHYNLNHFFVFSEFKGIVGPLSDEFITIGIIIPFVKKGKNDYKNDNK